MLKMASDLQVQFYTILDKKAVPKDIFSLPEVAAILFRFLPQVSLYAFRQSKPL